MMSSRIGSVLTGGVFSRAVVCWDGGDITAVCAPEETQSETYVSPGLIDLQINGGWGHDFTSEPESIWVVGGHLPAVGVTSFLPTIVSAPYDVTGSAIEVLQSGPPEGYRGAQAIGLHIEGPWLAPEYPGAHDRLHLRPPDADVALRWAESGVVSMVTMAPELPGADEAASVLSERGVVVSAGHTAADFQTGAEALRGPYGMVTHLFNQMTPFHHREPGMVGAALVSDRPCGLIADGVHAHPASVRLAWELLGASRLVLVTDAVGAMGADDGVAKLGELETSVLEGAPRDAAGALAGSVLSLSAAVRNLSEFAGAGLADSISSASSRPAHVLGLGDRGEIIPGRRADLLVHDDMMRVLETVVAGETVYRSRDV